MDTKTGACGIILISHGELAKGMLDGVRLLMGEQAHMTAYSLRPEERVEELTQQLRQEVRRYGADHLLILSDLQNGSPFNAAVELALEYPQIHHITGMNLSVVLSAVTARNADSLDPDLDRICSRIISETAGSIVDVRKLLADHLQADVEEEV